MTSTSLGLQVSRLSHRYSKAWAIRDLSFELNGAGIVGLLGPNGAGKSTTLNIICGVLYPTEGDVWIAGSSIRSDPLAAKSQLGFLPQTAPLFLDFTVREYLEHCARLKRVERSDRREVVHRSMERVGVVHFADRLIGALSGGYRQRVGLAQAVLHQPAVIVLDEPTNGLDPVQILEVRELIRDLSNDTTVILSTHVLAEAEALCDEVKMINHGEIVFEGTFDEFSAVTLPRSLILHLDNIIGADALKEVTSVTEVVPINKHKHRVFFSDADAVSRELLGAASRNDWRVREIFFERVSLESAFAHLSARSH